MMMQWGNDLADAIMLPCWIEASRIGEPLYRKMGYQDVVRRSWQTQTLNATFMQ